MKAKILSIVGILALTVPAASPAAKTNWTRWQAAQIVAGARGLPIAYYFQTTKPTSSGST